MPYIVWTPSKELGHAVIDREHRELIDLINRLVELLFDHTADDGESPQVRKAQVAAAVDALGKAAASHFASEDSIMRAVAYPAVAEHRDQHAALLRQFGDFAGHFRSAQAGSVALALRFLREWFEYHFEHYDAQLVGWLREQNERR